MDAMNSTTEQKPNQPLFTASELRSLDKLDGRNVYDHPLSPRLKALVYRARTAGYMVQRGMMAHQLTIYLTTAGALAIANEGGSDAAR